MANKVIQTTPNLGLNIKLQKVAAAPVELVPALVLDINGNVLASLGPGDEYTCQGAPSDLTGIKLMNFPDKWGQYPTPTFVNNSSFGSSYTVYLLPIGTFLSTDISWSSVWQGADVSQWCSVAMNVQTPGLLVLDVYLCCNNGGNPDATATLTLTATTSDGATASIDIDFLVQGF